MPVFFKCLSLGFLLTGENFDICTSVATRNLQISSLHPGSQVSAVSLPHPPTMSETEESLFSQLISGDFGLSGSPSALNPNKVILTVDHKTREVLCVCLMRAVATEQNWSATRAYAVNVFYLNFSDFDSKRTGLQTV